MRISASVEYATRILLRLSRLSAGETLSAEAVSREENIPRAYVDQIFQRLRRAKLVDSHRGAHGGYVLGRAPRTVTVGMLVRAVEGSVFDDVCEKYAEGEHQCSHLGGCNIRPVWQRLSQVVEGFLERVTLQDLISETPQAACSAPSGSASKPVAAAGSGKTTWEVP